MAALTLSLAVVAVAAIVAVALVWVTGLGRELQRIATGESGERREEDQGPLPGEDPS